MHVPPEISGAAVGSAVTGVLSVVGAWAAKHRPRQVVNAEARRADAEAGAHIASAYEKLVGDLQADIDRQNSHVEELRREGHKLRNRVQGLSALLKSTFAYADKLEEIVIDLGGVLPERPKIIEAEADAVGA